MFENNKALAVQSCAYSSLDCFKRTVFFINNTHFGPCRFLFKNGAHY